MKGGGRTSFTEDFPASTVRPGTRDCRECKFFVRVQEQNHNIGLRGFCSMGQNDGDYDLYVSSSYAGECPSYLLSKKAAEVQREEQALHESWRLAEKTAYNSAAQRKQKPPKGVEPWTWSMQRDLMVRKAAYQQWRRDNIDRLQRFWEKSAVLDQRGYRHIFDAVRTQVQRMVPS